MNAISKHFQITQQRRPLAVGGRINFTVLKSSTVPKVRRSRTTI
jgi:Asp-tRNA(Asn)/Glu-tRNA(Gln) amidotransferase B subunit